MQKITTFLTYDSQAEEAANLYVSVFKNSKVVDVTRYGEGAPLPKGSAMSVTFVLDGQEYYALNGGPHFTFSEGISLFVTCETQEEVDYFWEKLSEGADPGAQQCGWRHHGASNTGRRQGTGNAMEIFRRKSGFWPINASAS